MKNLFEYTLISILALAFIGCGSSQSDISDTDNTTLKEPTVTQAHKIDRANWVGVAPVDDGFFVTNDENLLSFKVADNSIANHQTRNIDIFIDADNNAQTGYTNPWWGNIGAEYLIENNNLYRHTGHGWHWDFVSHISRNQLHSNEIEFEVSKDIIRHHGKLRAIAGLSNQHWSPIRKTSVIHYELDSVEVNPTPNGYTILDDEQNIIFTIQSPNVSNGQMSTEDIFIDSDFNPESGYKNPRWGNIGADFLIEGDTLYRHNGGRWSWSRVGNVHREIDGNTLKVIVSKDQLNITNSFRSIAGLQNSQWQVIERYDVSTFSTTHNQRNIDMQRVRDQVDQLNPNPANIYDSYRLIGVSPNMELAIVKYVGIDSGNFSVYSIDQDSNIHRLRSLTDVTMGRHNADTSISAEIIDEHIFEYKYGLPNWENDGSVDSECTDRFDYTTGQRLSHECFNRN